MQAEIASDLGRCIFVLSPRSNAGNFLQPYDTLLDVLAIQQPCVTINAVLWHHMWEILINH